MNPAAADWYARATTSADDWPASRVLDLKQGTTVAVVIPARNEAATIGAVVEQVAGQLGSLVDELVVMDSLSDDATAAAAASAGAVVHSVAQVRPDLGVRAGKGEALWKSLFVTHADLLVFIDADLTEWGPHFVTGLLGPLLSCPQVQLVRGFYDRILDFGGSPSLEGGRVTELVARPWLAVHRPELSGLVQPLAGEWAIRRTTFESLSVPVGYGVELSTLLDVHDQGGLPAIAQVDLGRRGHRHQSLHDLGVMATELLLVADRRRSGPTHAPTDPGLVLPQIAPDRTWTERPVPAAERPPAVRHPAQD
jgi:glucosyl-3-phosphoglycerate synthase